MYFIGFKFFLCFKWNRNYIIFSLLAPLTSLSKFRASFLLLLHTYMYVNTYLTLNVFIGGVYTVSRLTTLHWITNKRSSLEEGNPPFPSSQELPAVLRGVTTCDFPSHVNAPWACHCSSLGYAATSRGFYSWLSGILALTIFLPPLPQYSLSHRCRSRDADASVVAEFHHDLLTSALCPCVLSWDDLHLKLFC